ncbi:hypothetical protein M1293_01220 [Candidatus Parvarchaeota archaeon]|nr:hypothetical protein [Candidatus Parvarchaeota archaeon]
MGRRPCLNNILNIVRPILSEKCCVIVEGKNDAKALVKLGIPESRIFQSAQISYDKLEPLIANFDVYIPMFDADRTGVHRLEKFLHYFSGMAIKIDMSYSEKLRSEGVVYIEGINRLIKI